MNHEIYETNINEYEMNLAVAWIHGFFAECVAD